MAEIDPKQPIVTPEVIVADDPLLTTDAVVIVQPVYTGIPPDRPRKVYAGMWGRPEIGAVSAGVFAILMALVAYFFWVVPSNNELVKNRSSADRLEAELISANNKYGEITDTESQVGKIIASVDDFEARFLPVISTGQAALYQRLNGLIRAYGLINTTGPDYSPLEPADRDLNQQTDQDKGRSKFRSLYPGVYVSTTVEGSYQNIRRFIREIETGREFIVVSAVELAPSESDSREEQRDNADRAERPAEAGPINPTYGAPNFQRFSPGNNPSFAQSQTPAAPKIKGKTHGETVSLHIELAAYFRRPATEQIPATQ